MIYITTVLKMIIQSNKLSRWVGRWVGYFYRTLSWNNPLTLKKNFRILYHRQNSSSEKSPICVYVCLFTPNTTPPYMFYNTFDFLSDGLMVHVPLFPSSPFRKVFNLVKSFDFPLSSGPRHRVWNYRCETLRLHPRSELGSWTSGRTRRTTLG